MGEAEDMEREEFAALAEGVIVGSKYRLVDQRGKGAMGAVWSATHLTLGHAVAVKFLNGSVMCSDSARWRFEREARLAARLGEASRHITRVIDHGVMEDGKPYLVMELLQGEGLSACLKREGRLPLVRAARVVQHLARALHVTHSAGVVHRDLKPANIFLCQAEEGDELFVKLLDFGIAKASAEQLEEHTGAGTVLGTPSYMSPEQVLGQGDIDIRSDLWAVAAIVYRMTVGRAPFGGGAIAELGLRILSIDPHPPSQLWPDLPKELDQWMARGLAKKPEERFQSARELADFLAGVAGISGQSVVTNLQLLAEPAVDRSELTTHHSRPRSRDPETQETPSIGAFHAAPAGVPRHGLISAIVVLGAAMLVGALAVGTLLGRHRPEPSVVTTSTFRTTPLPDPTLVMSEASMTPSVASAPAFASTSATAPSSVASTTATLPLRPLPTALPSFSFPPWDAGPKQKSDVSGWDNKKEL